MIIKLIQELFPLIEKTAPVIARALGYKTVSSVAPWALYFLSKAFGIRMNEVNQLPAAIMNDPESDHKLAELEQSFSDWFIDNTKEVARDIKISNVELNVKLNFENTVGTT